MFGAIAQAGFGAGMSIYERQMQADILDANANIRRRMGQERAADIESERGRLTDQQRKIKATQRMSVASRGGLTAGTDLLTLAQQAKEMQMDQLEMVRQRDIEIISAENEAKMLEWQAEAKKPWKSWGKKLGDPKNWWYGPIKGEWVT